MLKEAGVVDAGGAGLLEIIRGVRAAVAGEPAPEAPPEPVARTITSPAPAFGLTWNAGWFAPEAGRIEQMNAATKSVAITFFVGPLVVETKIGFIP